MRQKFPAQGWFCERWNLQAWRSHPPALHPLSRTMLPYVAHVALKGSWRLGLANPTKWRKGRMETHHFQSFPCIAKCLAATAQAQPQSTHPQKEPENTESIWKRKETDVFMHNDFANTNFWKTLHIFGQPGGLVIARFSRIGLVSPNPLPAQTWGGNVGAVNTNNKIRQFNAPHIA